MTARFLLLPLSATLIQMMSGVPYHCHHLSLVRYYRNGHVWLTKVKDVISSILITVKSLTLFLMSLLKNLEAVGITGKFLNWIGNFKHCRKQRVVVEGVCSNWSHVSSGVSYGSVLGPVLFLIYINDLPKCVSCRIRMYAD